MHINQPAIKTYIVPKPIEAPVIEPVKPREPVREPVRVR